jgi:hypothetical protein
MDLNRLDRARMLAMEAMTANFTSSEPNQVSCDMRFRKPL